MTTGIPPATGRESDRATDREQGRSTAAEDTTRGLGWWWGDGRWEVDDRGSVALVMVVLTVAMFAMAGLVIDGGAALAARGKAANLAQEASRAGVGALVPASLRGNSPADIELDTAGATRAAQQVLAAGDARGEVTVGGDAVTVTARVERRTVVLSAFGVTNLTGTATASATLVYGTDTGQTIGSLP